MFVIIEVCLMPQFIRILDLASPFIIKVGGASSIRVSPINFLPVLIICIVNFAAVRVLDFL